MRTIKFRAWDTACNEFLSKDEDWCWNILKNLNEQPFDRYIVQQYTGLKDKNGKEIYEGDILMIQFHKNAEEPSRYYPVEFHKGSFCMNCGSEDGYFLLYDGEYEVVGNIFENPELIK